MPSIQVKDANSNTQTINTLPAVGSAASAASLPVVIASDQAAVPVSATALPLPAGAATAALQSAVQSAAGTSAASALTVQGVAGGVAQPVSATSLPLPAGAATAANQTATQSAPGTAAGTALTVQGAASGVPLPVAPALATANGWKPKLLNGLAATVTSIKNNAAGQLAMLEGFNSSTTAQAYLQVFDVATPGGVTLGTTPPVLSLPIAPGAVGGFALSQVGVQFANGIQVAATTTATGSTAAAGDANALFN
jgi:hypothetical protein